MAAQSKLSFQRRHFTSCISYSVLIVLFIADFRLTTR